MIKLPQERKKGKMIKLSMTNMPFTLHAVSSNLIRASASTTYLRCTAASSPQASPHATAPSAHHAVEPFFFSSLFGEKENRAALADGLARLPVRGLCLGICFIWAESSMWPSKFTEFAGPQASAFLFGFLYENLQPT